jgi:peptide-methionine (R)-S-oxide reductase
MKAYRKNSEAVSRLTPEQYRVTQQDGTEKPFDKDYWDNEEPGLCVGVVSGEPLLASFDKYDCGRSSFVKPIDAGNVVEHRDASHGTVRTEVRSTHGDSHLGQVPPDGPREAGGLHYCINSASLWLIHRDELESEDYGEVRKLSAEKGERV